MKFTKTAFRSAFKTNNQTLIWKLAFLKLGHTPTKSEVYELIMDVVNPILKKGIAWAIAYTSYRKTRINGFNAIAWNNRGAYRQYDVHYYRAKALEMLRRLHTEPLTTHTKIANFGHTQLYFCSPIYGHADYNKVCTCPLNGPLATDKDGNRYDPQAAWCGKVLDLSNRIYNKKKAAYSSAV